MTDDKYVVFKRDEFDKWATECWGTLPPSALPFILEDATVIRGRDIFAPPALDAYANAIECVIEAIKGVPANEETVDRLRDVSDYFHRRATQAYNLRRKLPD